MGNNENSATEKEQKSIPRWRSQTQCFSIQAEYTDMDDSTSEEMLGVAEEKITLTHEKLAEELNDFATKNNANDDDTDDVTSDTEEFSDFMQAEARPEEMFLTPDDASEIISSNTSLSLDEKIRQVSQIPTQALMMEEDLGIKVVKREKASTKKLSNEEILNLILQGETIENQDIDCLDLREQEFDNPIKLIHCEIGEILADGSDFNSSFTLQNCSIQGDFNFGGNGISLIKGLLTLKEVEVQGNLNWSKATFSKKLHIIDCDFVQALNLTEVSLENGCIISNCHIPSILLPNSYIAGTFIIKDTTIAKNFNLSNSQILGIFNADSTTFSQWNCTNSHFQSKLEFSKCTFEKSSVFREMQVNESITIEKSILDSDVHFEKAHIKENFLCIKSQFSKNVDFTKMVVYRHIIFDNVIFKTYVGFSNASVTSIKILHTIFVGIVSFQATTFFSDVSFIDVTFENNVYFNRAIIYQKANFQDTKFNKAVSLSNIIGDYIRFSREQIQGKLLAEVEKDRKSLQNEYNTLERLFQKQGDYKARDWAHYNALRLERKSRKFSLNPFKICSRLGNYLFLDVCSGYGTKSKNVVWFSIALILFFGMLYTGIDILKTGQNEIDSPKLEQGEGNSINSEQNENNPFNLEQDENDTSKLEQNDIELLKNLSRSMVMPVICFPQEDDGKNSSASKPEIGKNSQVGQHKKVGGRANQTGSKKSGSNQTGSKKGGSNQTGSKKSGSNQTGSKKGGANQTGSKKGGANQTGTESQPKESNPQPQEQAEKKVESSKQDTPKPNTDFGDTQHETQVEDFSNKTDDSDSTGFGIPKLDENSSINDSQEDISKSENISNTEEEKRANESDNESLNEPNVFFKYYSIAKNHITDWYNSGYNFVDGKLKAWKIKKFWKNYGDNINKGFTRSCCNFFPIYNGFEYTFLGWIEHLCGLFCIFSLLIAIMHTKMRL